MADSRRQRIVDAVIARMMLINGTGVYETALGTTIDENGDTVPSVADSRTHWEQDELPAISVFDGDAIASGRSSVDPKAIIHRMSILIRGYVVQTTTAADCRTLIKDILTAIRQDDRWTVSNVKLVMQSEPVKDAITRNPESFEVEACEVEFEVQFMTEKFNAE
jgi:hypothetical protein